MSDIALKPLTAPIDTSIAPPGSKSLTNRALVLAALSDGISDLRNSLFADDTLVMIESLMRLGFRVIVDRNERMIRVHGRSGKIPATQADLFVGNSGTTVRFLTAMCTLGRGRYCLDGIPRMRERPIRPLVTLLKNLGARIRHTLNPDCPPVEILADGLPGGFTPFAAESSSQYLSALLMSAPYARHEVHVDLAPNQTSWPYVEMTLRLMDQFGHTPELERDPLTREPKLVVVPKGCYAPTQYDVEPDASNASYFLALAAVHPGSRVLVRGLSETSLQGDARYGRVLERAGVKIERLPDGIRATGPDRLAPFDVDLSDMPDLAQTTAVVALYADGPSVLRGLHTLRVKETDRLAALDQELTRLGATIKIEDECLYITPPATIKPARIHTYDDHRMAMSFAIAATRSEGVVITDAECVNKTYPNYFDDLRSLIGD